MRINFTQFNFIGGKNFSFGEKVHPALNLKPAINCDCVTFAGMAKRKKLNSVGEENFPSASVLEEYKGAIRAADDVSLLEIHKKHYQGLLECTTLEAVKEKYPEFKDVKDASKLEKADCTGFFARVKAGKVFEGGKKVGLEDLSLILLQKHYAKAIPHSSKGEYFGIDPKTFLNVFQKLNIKPLARKYMLTISRETPERRAIYAKTAENYWSDLSRRAAQADKMRKMHEREGFEEKRINSIKENWADDERREELSAINKKSLVQRWAAPDSKEKFSEFMKEKWQDDAYRAKVSEGESKSMIEIWKRSEYKELRSKIMLELWQQEEFREKVSTSMKARWQEPEYREKMAVYSEALKFAWEEHKDISGKMAEIAEEFPSLPRILTKKAAGESLNIDELHLMASYYKRCHELIPDFTRIVGQTQRRILIEWGVISPNVDKK